MKLEDEKQPIRLILIGFVLIMLGAVLPFLMVMGVIDLPSMPGITGILLALFTASCTTAGMFLGIIGSAQYVRMSQKKKK